MGDLVHLDSHRSLSEIIKRDYKADVFLMGMVVKDEIHTYISEDMTYSDIVMILDILEARKSSMFPTDE